MGLEVRGRCYYIGQGRLQHHEADSACAKRGARLVSFNSQEELDGVGEAVCRYRASAAFSIGIYNPPVHKSELYVIHTSVALSHVRM